MNVNVVCVMSAQLGAMRYKREKKNKKIRSLCYSLGFKRFVTTCCIEDGYTPILFAPEQSDRQQRITHREGIILSIPYNIVVKTNH